MRAVEAQGYSKDTALENTGLDVSLDKLKNATQAWKKAGSPMGTKALNQFVSDYVKKYKVVGIYLVVEASSADTRLRPYSVINETTTGKRKAKTTYQIKEAEFKVKTKKVTTEDGEDKEVSEVEVVSLGAVEARADRKDAAMKLMKELIEVNKKDYVIEIVKEITEGQKYAGYGLYTPSKSAKLGKFLFFVNE